jgi:hypothetical protein
MKTTLEIPDGVFRRAKARAAELRVPLRKFVSDAVAEKLESQPAAQQKARRALVGQLRHLHAETQRINSIIEEEFERIEPEDRA